MIVSVKLLFFLWNIFKINFTSLNKVLQILTTLQILPCTSAFGKESDNIFFLNYSNPLCNKGSRKYAAQEEQFWPREIDIELFGKSL